MPEEPKIPPPTTEEVAKAALAKMSQDEIDEVNRIVQRALHEHDLPRFQAGLLKLGYDENSRQFEKMMQLWDEFHRASR